MKTVTNLTNNVLGTTKQFYLAGLGIAVTVTDRSKQAFDQLVEKRRERLFRQH